MNVRDAVEADAAALAAVGESPTEAMRSVIHDRTVRVALDDSPAEPGEEETDPDDVLGFVSFDARDGVVHVTQFGGTEEACARLLEDPLRFASNESMSAELLVLEEEAEMREAAEAAGFDRTGSGPLFEGKPTVRYRVESP
ncbi:hypothetical protein [Halorarum salinum]|uniref:N-acetyltransferase domain-containing protein n=1 Tax=Halorarum salinum TaxID=2743089 RepID=A0A7D5Q9N6_9EURY|nr:hypothetical protein [Halobaculum salinum]QLG60899.1 hypothetical protein HUG12_03730 [Halobaculum salinum]